MKLSLNKDKLFTMEMPHPVETLGQGGPQGNPLQKGVIKQI